MSRRNTVQSCQLSKGTLVDVFEKAEAKSTPSRKHRDVLNAGPLEKLKENRFHIVQHGSRSIGIYKLGEKVYAIRNQCPHMGAPLCQGQIGSTYRPVGKESPMFQETLSGRVVRCPWHGWEFDMVTGKGLYDVKSRVATYEVRINPANEIEILV